MSERRPGDPPSPFVERCLQLFSTTAAAGSRRALDIATGRGRHSLRLAEAGWRVFGVDHDLDALREAVEASRRSGYVLRAWCADLTMFPLPRERFELIVVTRYLQRDLFPALRHALTPGGVIIYETFTTEQRRHGKGPTSADRLLMPGELRQQFTELEILLHEEVTEPDAYARVCARKYVGRSRPEAPIRRSVSGS